MTSVRLVDLKIVMPSSGGGGAAPAGGNPPPEGIDLPWWNKDFVIRCGAKLMKCDEVIQCQ